MDVNSQTETADAPAAEQGGPVRKRLVFYISGFDPRGPNYYHRLYAEQAKAQATLNGLTISVSDRRNRGRLVSRWSVRAEAGGLVTETDYRLLRWDDIVRRRWKQDEVTLLREIWRSAAAFTRAGVGGLMLRRGPAAFMAGATPLVVSTLYLAAALGLVAALGAAGYGLAARLGFPGWIGALPPLLLLTQLMRVWRWIDTPLAIGWLNRCFTYMHDNAADASQAEARCDAFAALIAESAASPDIDEILLIGHSQGTLHALRTAARVLALAPGIGRGGATFSLLTLGQPFAVYTPLGDDRNFRRDLAAVAASDRLVWLDETSPGDPVSSCGLDPLNGMGDVPGRLWPVRKSPRFHLLLGRERFRRIKLRPLDFHFQYVMAGEIAGAYDYFLLTAGPHRLLDGPGA
jgi:hypothetical protein